MSSSVGDAEHHGDRTSLRHELHRDLSRAEMADATRMMRGGRKRGVDAETAEKEQITDSIDVKHMSAGTCKWWSIPVVVPCIHVMWPQLVNVLSPV